MTLETGKMTPLNWTSTTVPMWQSDCQELRKLQRSFELRDVGLENEKFVEVFAARFDFDIERIGSTVIFRQKES